MTPRTQALSAFITLALLLAAIAAAIAFGGPAPIAPLASINQPFAKVDFSTVPPVRRYAARDGTSLAWHGYPAASAALDARRIVLVHGSSARGRSMHLLAQALAAAGFNVAALDMRGHGESGPRGQAAYIGLRLLNTAGVTAWNALPVINFGLNDVARQLLTPSYSNTLAANFGPHNDYLGDIRGARGALRIVAGRDDELFHVERFAEVFASAGKAVPITLVPGVKHMGLTLGPAALQAVVQACRA